MKGYDINIHLNAKGVLRVTVESPAYPQKDIMLTITDLGLLRDFKADSMSFIEELMEEPV